MTASTYALSVEGIFHRYVPKQIFKMSVVGPGDQNKTKNLTISKTPNKIEKPNHFIHKLTKIIPSTLV